jgi:hypothetical protein
MAIASVNLLYTSMNRSMTFTTNTDCSSSISSVFEDSENEVSVTNNSNQLSKHPTSSQGEGVTTTKQVVLGVLDSNAQRSSYSDKGKNSHYNYIEYVL